MDSLTCVICQNELAPQWNFCVHCGAPVRARAAVVDDPILSHAVNTGAVNTGAVNTGRQVAALHNAASDAEAEAIPSAIRPESSTTHPRRRIDARLAFGIAMAAIGLLIVLYAVTSLLAARG
ncbi:hypothetical protein GCM10027052_00840 [Parafrigoribacterium mesophilum]|uniref:hypothetical protein n=1 Tax=Parafrigoribacterium mesophilum TaxID=433646 RepID=UPI0031FD25B8